jgi:hypothetical protein
MEFPFIFMRAYLNCVLLAAPLLVHAAEPLKLQRADMPKPPWPAGDERGMANQLGSATWNRCAWHMSQPGAQAYEARRCARTPCRSRPLPDRMR